MSWTTQSRDEQQTLDDLQSFRARNLKKTVYGFCPITGNGGTDGGGRSSAHRAPASALSPSPSPSALPRRLWQSLAHAAGIIAEDKWADVSKAKLSALAQQLTACEFQVYTHIHISIYVCVVVCVGLSATYTHPKSLPLASIKKLGC